MIILFGDFFMTTVIQHFKFTVTEEIHYTTYTSPFVDAMQAFKVQ